MSLFYQLAYRIGFTPWEHAAVHPPAARHVHALFAREEQDLAAPRGRALDIGCGSGHWSVILARRGWQVFGIDIVPRAVQRARHRAAAAGVDVRFELGDITRLSAANPGNGFRLAWDFGTLHGLAPSQRLAAGGEIDAVMTDDAVILLLAWKPGHRAGLPRGMDRNDVKAMLPAWRIVNEEPFDASGLPRPLRSVEPRVYRLRRQ